MLKVTRLPLGHAVFYILIAIIFFAISLGLIYLSEGLK
jgi:hypothetical protein